MTIPRRRRVTFLAKRREKKILRRTKKYLRKSNRLTPGFGTRILQKPEYAKNRKVLRKSYRKRRHRKQEELSFFGVTAKDLNMNPNRRR